MLAYKAHPRAGAAHRHAFKPTEAASNARAPEGPLFRGSHAYAYVYKAADPTRGQSLAFGRSSVRDRKSARLESRNDSLHCVCIQLLTESVFRNGRSESEKRAWDHLNRHRILGRPYVLEWQQQSASNPMRGCTTKSDTPDRLSPTPVRGNSLHVSRIAHLIGRELAFPRASNPPNQAACHKSLPPVARSGHLRIRRRGRIPRSHLQLNKDYLMSLAATSKCSHVRHSKGRWLRFGLSRIIADTLLSQPHLGHGRRAINLRAGVAG
jgi:hypothetical protein